MTTDPLESESDRATGRVSLVLASASPARLSVLRQAGIEPRVVVSGVDESAVTESRPDVLAQTLARMKGEEVAGRIAAAGESPVLLVACDSVLDVDGVPFGKPEDPDTAKQRLRALSARTAVLHTGHYVLDVASRAVREATASTTVRFGRLSDDEIDAYVATGEPLTVAGSFTIDGRGGAFVDGVDGDPSNVVGISLPLVRSMAASLGFAWYRLWNRLPAD